MDEAKAKRDVEDFLDDTIVTKKLTLLSLVISLFELVGYQVVNSPKLFFNRDIRLVGGKIIAVDETEDYIREVKSLIKKDLFKSSALWYLKSEIVNQQEYDLLLKFRKDRTDAAHEIVNILFDSDFKINKGEILQIGDIHKKICLWWIKEVESTINPAFDEIDRDAFDFEGAIQTQLFPITRLIELLNKINEEPQG